VSAYVHSCMEKKGDMHKREDRASTTKKGRVGIEIEDGTNDLLLYIRSFSIHATSRAVRTGGKKQPGEGEGDSVLEKRKEGKKRGGATLRYENLGRGGPMYDFHEGYFLFLLSAEGQGARRYKKRLRLTKWARWED